MKEIIITLGNKSDYAKQEKLTVRTIGMNPEFGFIFIDGTCYTLTKKVRGGFSLKKTK